MKTLLLVGLIFASIPVYGQDSLETSRLTFQVYLEAYYCYDSGQPENGERSPFFYNYSRHNEVSLNIGFIKASYSRDRVRANLGMMAGTYAQANLAAEPQMLRHVLEATIGLKISAKKDLWIDAGIMPSHIGFESVVGRDCWTLSRSILADNSPYYQAGLRLGYTSRNEKWYGAIFYLNGWQKIQRVQGNSTPAFGTQLSYTPTKKAMFNWSTYIGNEYPDSVRKWRYFHNLYARIQVSRGLGLIAGFDVGMEQELTRSDRLNTWYSPVVIARYRLGDRFSLAARGEYYSDDDGVIINTGKPNGTRTAGYSLNLDYSPDERTMIRMEGRGLQDKNQLFIYRDKAVNWNYFLTASCSVIF